MQGHELSIAGHTKLGPSWSLPSRSPHPITSWMLHKAWWNKCLLKKLVISVEGGRMETLNLISSSGKETQRKWTWRIKGYQLWNNENKDNAKRWTKNNNGMEAWNPYKCKSYVITSTPKSHLYVLPTLCSKHKVLGKRSMILPFLLHMNYLQAPFTTVMEETKLYLSLYTNLADSP